MRYLKMILTGLLLAGLVIGISPRAFAAEPQSSATQATVTFQPEDNGGSGENTGALRLDKVPDIFNFGTQTLSSQPQDYTLNTESHPTLTVTDNRGTGTGWEVTVQAPKLQTPSGKTLDGGNIVIDQSQNLNGNGSVSQPPIVSPSVTADTVDASGNPVPVVIAGAEADQHQGMGTWAINWEYNQVHLKINPGEAFSGEPYTTTITWTLNNTPVE